MADGIVMMMMTINNILDRLFGFLVARAMGYTGKACWTMLSRHFLLFLFLFYGGCNV
jgi:hypothetical protein